MTFKRIFHNKSVLITGATGSIGSAITEKVLKYKCKVVRAISNDEDGIYKLSEKLIKKNETLNLNMKKNNIRYLVGDIRDLKRCEEISKNIDIVIHAAAMKHVPICEYNPQEAIKTNVVGTKNMIKASIKNKVKKFLFISTDKVVNPTSFMGKTKLEAEKIVLQANNIKKNKYSLFSVIRFGNIIGSRGSVLPKFLKQIKLSENLTITNKKMTRFFITINLAVREIFESIKIMRGGEIFIINNMMAFKINDLAKALKEFFKYKKSIVENGIREGEKIYEELATSQEIKTSNIKKNLLILNYDKKYKKSKYNEKINLYTLNSSKVKLLNKKFIIKFLKSSKLI